MCSRTAGGQNGAAGFYLGLCVMGSKKNNLKPMSTEYKGVVYRSKSEALFARWLELCSNVSGFYYEPQFIVEGWNPDFLCLCIDNPDDEQKNPIDSFDLILPKLRFLYIEYKPCLPTETYIRNWESCCEKFAAKNSSRYNDDLFEFWLYYGGFYSEPGRLVYKDGFTQFADEQVWLPEHVKEQCLSTRFDLPSQRWES
jgi:hypothetical protein